MSPDTDRIRLLNDDLRQHLVGGGAVMTAGIAALGPEAVSRLVQTVGIFNDFCTANDALRRARFRCLRLRWRAGDVQDRLFR